MRGRGSVAFCCVLFLMTALVGRRSIRLESGSNRIHHWNCHRPQRGSCSRGYGHGNIAGARSHLRWRQRTILDFIESLNSLLAPIASR